MTISFKSGIVMRKTVIILSVFALIVSSCGRTTRKQTGTENDTQNFQDTIIVKHMNILNKSDSIWLSKSYTYYWLAGKDTLDFRLSVREWKRENTLHLRLFHREPMLFTDVLGKIETCLSLIEEDFNLLELISLNFMEPIFYLDLATKLTSEYELEFGRKIINFSKFNNFLLESSLTSQLNHFLNPLNKKVKRYGLEKFFLIEKKHYAHYLPNVDFTDYPEFTFNAHTGVFVSLENK